MFDAAQGSAGVELTPRRVCSAPRLLIQDRSGHG
jgi:hypothetical protein